MNIRELLSESNVNHLAMQSGRLSRALLTRLVNQAIEQTGFEELKRQAEEVDFEETEFARDEIPAIVEQFVEQLETVYKRLAIDEVTKRYGSIQPLDDSGSSVQQWHKLWWVGDIIVWLGHSEQAGDRTHGMFNNTPDDVKQQFPKHLLRGIRKYGGVCVGVYIGVNLHRFQALIREAIAREIFENGSSKLHIKPDSSLDVLLINLSTTYTHEVTHLLQWVHSMLDIEKRRVKNASIYTYQAKSYATKKAQEILYAIGADASKWSNDEWRTYLSSAVEIDAHAVSVASSILQQYHMPDNPADEIELLKTAVGDLSVGYLERYSGSFANYYHYIRSHASPEELKTRTRIWQRFLKKIAMQLTHRIDELTALVSKKQDQ